MCAYRVRPLVWLSAASWECSPSFSWTRRMRRQPRKPRRLVHPAQNNPAARTHSSGQASNKPPVEKLINVWVQSATFPCHLQPHASRKTLTPSCMRSLSIVGLVYRYQGIYKPPCVYCFVSNTTDQHIGVQIHANLWTLQRHENCWEKY